MSDSEDRTSVLFVCMGNICRSPTAEGVFRHHVAEAGLDDAISVDSAGTHAYHVGEPPDRRSAAAASRRGISLDGIRARRVADEDFERFCRYLVQESRDNDRPFKLIINGDAFDFLRIEPDMCSGAGSQPLRISSMTPWPAVQYSVRCHSIWSRTPRRS